MKKHMKNRQVHKYGNLKYMKHKGKCQNHQKLDLNRGLEKPSELSIRKKRR
jgi:hypothetical protein